VGLGLACHAQNQDTKKTADGQVARIVGNIKNTQPDSLTLTPDSGGEVTATLSGSTKILRVPPGEKDLKNATPLQVKDLQPGDRVLVRGQASTDGHSITALAVVVMKQQDVSAKHSRIAKTGRSAVSEGWSARWTELPTRSQFLRRELQETTT
jgi:hypothetical protein